MKAQIQRASPRPTIQSPKTVDSRTFFASSKASRQMTEPPNTKIEPTMNIIMLSTIMDGYSGWSIAARLGRTGRQAVEEKKGDHQEKNSYAQQKLIDQIFLMGELALFQGIRD